MANRKLVSGDIEADGPVPGLYSMVSFGLVIVEDGLKRTFLGKVKPISDDWIPEALAVSGISREEHLTYDSPEEVMKAAAQWLNQECPDGATFIADNPAFDFAFLNYYFHRYYGRNPFGFSARRIGDLICGRVGNYWYQWKRHRKTKHTHNPVDDAKGNAEALLYLRDNLDFKLP